MTLAPAQEYGITSAPSTAARAPSGAVLTATKLQIPRARSGLVPRARLVALLIAAGKAKLVLVEAPVGSGKTTLLAEWHATPTDARPFAWFSLDPADNDPVRFLEGGSPRSRRSSRTSASRRSWISPGPPA